MFQWTHGGPAALRMVVLHEVKISKEKKKLRENEAKDGICKTGQNVLYDMWCSQDQCDYNMFKNKII